MKEKILCVAGKSGSGKSLIVEYIEKKYNIPMIRSHTSRLPRYEGEDGHTFHTVEEYSKIPKEKMIAFTSWIDEKTGEPCGYCCLVDDVKPGNNTYVIDESGIDYLKEHFGNKYDVKTLLIERDYDKRLESAGQKRVDRDENMFYKTLNDYDYVIFNNYPIYNLHRIVDNIISDFFGIKEVQY